MQLNLTPRQATLLHGWVRPKPSLGWCDVLRRGHTLDGLLGAGLRPSELAVIQPDPKLWAMHCGASLKHLRLMLAWPANPFEDLGADLADVLSLRPSAEELVRMGVTYAQLKRQGLTAQTERLFRFDPEEWELLGKGQSI